MGGIYIAYIAESISFNGPFQTTQDNMQFFTIRDIENLCGIKAHTLRIWEQRYDFLSPKRKTSNHRIYDNEDLKELLRITFLYHRGYKISHIAKLNLQQIQEVILQTVLPADNQTLNIHQLLEACIDFDEEKFEKIINCVILRIGIDKTITTVFYPLLERIGRLWVTNKVIPGQEHFASNLIQKKMINAIDGLEKVKNRDHCFALFTMPGEHHEIPLLLAAYHFRKNHIHTVYCGTNIHPASLLAFTTRYQFTHFYTHLTTDLPADSAREFLLFLNQHFPKTPVTVCGPESSLKEKALPQVQFLHTLPAFDQFINQLKSK